MLADRVGLDPIATIRAKMEKSRRTYPVERAKGRAERLRDMAEVLQIPHRAAESACGART